jgi:membrane-bound lytic murein transglycosylase D
MRRSPQSENAASRGKAGRRCAWIAGALLLLHAPAVPADPGQTITTMLNVPLPATLELCGEKVPLAREDVAERLEIELMVILSNPVSTSLWFKRGERYFPLIEEKIRKIGLPRDLRYVPVVESNLRADAVSSARAVGPWQFMYSTAKTYGLERSSWSDERKNWEEATDAGLRHLKDLYDTFESWPLALAAYNAGKRRVADAMKKQGQADFFGLSLPKETERYVFRIMAAKMVMERPRDFGINLEDARLYPPEQAVGLRIDVTRSRLPLSAVADAAGSSYRQIKILNAWIVGDALPKGSHTVKIPAAARDSFREAMARWEADNPEPRIVYHKVRRGDTLSTIARKYGVRLGDLIAWNLLSATSIIHPGQRLEVRRTN